MFPEIRSGQGPGPIRIGIGIVLMMLVAMLTFATPRANAEDGSGGHANAVSQQAAAPHHYGLP